MADPQPTDTITVRKGAAEETVPRWALPAWLYWGWTVSHDPADVPEPEEPVEDDPPPATPPAEPPVVPPAEEPPPADPPLDSPSEG